MQTMQDSKYLKKKENKWRPYLKILVHCTTDEKLLTLLVYNDFISLILLKMHQKCGMPSKSVPELLNVHFF